MAGKQEELEHLTLIVKMMRIRISLQWTLSSEPLKVYKYVFGQHMLDSLVELNPVQR